MLKRKDQAQPGIGVFRVLIHLLLAICVCSAPALSEPVGAADSPDEVTIRGQRYRVVDDMLLDIESESVDIKSFRRDRWAGGIIYYTFDSNVSDNREILFERATEAWEGVVPGLDFRECDQDPGENAPCENEGNYIHVEASTEGNSAYVGMKGGEQPLRLQNWSRRTIVHEIGHALGFNHEQSRGDRDAFVRINWNDILEGAEHNFYKYRGVHYSDYDFGSVMHYRHDDFGVEDPPGSGTHRTTISPRPSFEHETMGNHECNFDATDDCISEADAEGMRRRYEPIIQADDACSFEIEPGGWVETETRLGMPASSAYYRLLPDRTWIFTPTGHLEIQPVAGTTGSFDEAGSVEITFPGPDEPGILLYTDEDLNDPANSDGGRKYRYPSGSGPIHLWFWMGVEADAWTTIEMKHCFNNSCSEVGYAHFTIHAVCTPPEADVSLTPEADLFASGEEGGPFQISTRSYQLANDGTAAASFDVDVSYEGAATGWLSIAPVAGEVAAGESVELDVAVNGNASSLGPGEYRATLTVTAAGEAFVRDARLRVDETLPPRVSGRVSDGSGQPVEGVRIDGLPWVVWTDANGEYSVPVDEGWSGTVDPFGATYDFVPSERSFSNVTSSVTADFVGTAKTEIIAGRVTFNGAGLAGVTIGGLPGDPLTDSNGEYAVTVPFQWSGTVTPSKQGFVLSPSSRSYDRVGMSRFEEDYTAVQQTVTISGRVTDRGSPLEGVWLGGLPGGVTTDANGDYVGLVPHGWTGTATPSKHGFVFTPATRTYTNLISSQSGEDYTASISAQAGRLWIVSTSEELRDASIRAASGDLILVKPGTYTELRSLRDNVILISEAGADQTLIELSGYIRFIGDNNVIDGFTFRNLSTTLEPVQLAVGDNMQVRNCIFHGNGTEYGLRITSGNDILIENNVFASGNGILLRADNTTGSLTIRNNRFSNLGVGALVGANSNLDIVLENNLFEGNTRRGLEADSGLRSLRIENNIFAGNNDGLELDGNPGALIKNCVFFNNTRGADVSGSAQATFENAIFVGNGRGIDIASSSAATVHHTMHWNNTNMWHGSGTLNWDWDTIWEEDPQLVDPGAGDFHLAPTSPARARGTGGVDLGAYGGPRGNSWTMPPGAPSPPVLEALQVSGATEVQPETSLNLDADGQYSGGYQADVTALALWTSSDPTILESLGGGLFQAHRPGTVTITASLDGQNDQQAVTVVPASLSVSLSDDIDPAAPGELLTLTLTAANAGPATAGNAIVTTDLAPELSFVSATPSPDSGTDDSWTLGDLSAGASVTIEITVRVSPAAADGAVLTSSALVMGDFSAPAQTTEATTIAGVSDLVIDQEADLAAVDPGGQIDYTISYQNVGSGTATDVVLTEIYSPEVAFASADPLPDSGDNVWRLGALAAGESGSITVTVVVDDQAVGTIVNQVTLFGAENDPTTENNTAEISTPVNPRADLELALASGLPSVVESEIFSYFWSVTNLGPAQVTAVELIDSLPSGLSLVEATASQGGSCSTSVPVTCSLGTLARGATVVIEMEVRAETAGSPTLSATVSADEPDPDSTNNVASGSLTIDPAVDLLLQKTSYPASVASGPVTYTLTVENLGPSDSTGGQVRDVLPPGLTFSSSSDGCSDAEGTVTCPVGPLAVEEVVSLSFVATVDSGEVGSIVNTATVSGNETDLDLSNNAASSTIQVPNSPPILDPIGPFTIDAGELLTFTATASDPNGDALAFGLLNAPVGAAIEPATGAFSWTPTDAQGGQTHSFEIVVTDDDPSDPLSDSATVEVTVTIPDHVPPTVTRVEALSATFGTEVSACGSVAFPVDELRLSFSEVLDDPPGDTDVDDVTHAANYLLLAAGPDQNFDTDLCATLFGDDQPLVVDAVSWDEAARTATLTPAGPLADGLHRLLACGSTSLYDLAGNPLDGDGDGVGGDDFRLDFRVDAGNAFTNGRLDCDLGSWTATSAHPAEIVFSGFDAAGSSFSGSAHLTNLTAGTDFALGQCAPSSAGSHRLSARLRLDVADGVGVSVAGSCELFAQASCAGTSLGVFALSWPVDDTAGSWSDLVVRGEAPDGTVSARCGFALSVPGGESFDAYLDDLELESRVRLFSSTFEAGGVEEWDFAVP